jgi:serine/threonine protein kinase
METDKKLDSLLLGQDTRPIPSDKPSAPAPDELAGTLVGDRFLIERKLGQGGFGSVYLAVDKKVVSRKVVIKVMHDDEMKNEWSVKRFKQEIEALARIDHPSIVGIIDAGEMSNGKPYIVMQYVDGVSLRSLMEPEGMDFARAANIIRQIGRALESAHERGILHRDLKPENIMLQRLGGDDHVKVIDFGIAKVKNSITSLSTARDQTVGTVAYMSPEQLRAEELTPASDVYSMGVIAYEMVTGRRPLNPDSAYQLLELQRVVRVDPAVLRPTLPSAAQPIILKALAFEPQDRYEHAREFGDLLFTALTNDDEETLFEDAKRKQSQEQLTEQVAETAHVLFMDIVGYSKLLMDQQSAQVQVLQKIVRNSSECQRAHKNNKCIRLPTGDGMALVFSGEPESAVKSAVEISRALKDHPEIELRMGVHSGLVYRMADINTNLNVAGGGINIAQRVMDCGDAGHILLSKRVADDLGQFATWERCLRDLGETEVKHGLRIHIFNLSSDQVGNPAVPNKLQRRAPRSLYFKIGGIAAALALVLIAVLAVASLKSREGRVNVTPPVKSESVTTPGPEQSFSYWLTVQPMYRNKPQGPPIESSGDLLFGTGWKFDFNFRPGQEGVLYLLNVGPAENGAEEYNVLFPTPKKNKGSAKLAADQTMQAGPYDFIQKTGIEKLWVIWSAQALPDLEGIFDRAAKNRDNPGVIDQSDRLVIDDSYLKKYDPKTREVTADQSKQRSLVKSHGEVVITLIELRHHGYSG